MLYELNEGEPFPGVEDVVDGMWIAQGGDLSPKRLMEAYSRGIFPYFAFRFECIRWCCPTDRFVIFPDEIHVSHSMRTLMNKGNLQVTFDKSFFDVICGCAAIDDRYDQPFAWLGDDIIKAYNALHKLGHAHSVEVWEGDYLVGGLYGVSHNGCFMGESMFSLEPSASKLALISLARKLQAEGGKFIDCQFETPHLVSMGGRHIPYDEYMRILNE